MPSRLVFPNQAFLCRFTSRRTHAFTISLPLTSHFCGGFTSTSHFCGGYPNQPFLWRFPSPQDEPSRFPCDSWWFLGSSVVCVACGDSSLVVILQLCFCCIAVESECSRATWTLDAADFGKWRDGVSNHSACKMVSLVSRTTGDIYLTVTCHGLNRLFDSNLEMLLACSDSHQLCS